MHPINASVEAKVKAKTKVRKINSALNYQQQLTPIKIICQYHNNTPTIQVVCISNIEGYFFERTVFPDQKLLFETFTESVLEIHTGALPTAIIADRIPCLNLQITDSYRAQP